MEGDECQHNDDCRRDSDNRVCNEYCECTGKYTP